uniref:Uncharacterized protein n=1 Tax=Eutreptiella gymnastica TaxID=73025 RepID=A0A7S4CR28_9EUGL
MRLSRGKGCATAGDPGTIVQGSSPGEIVATDHLKEVEYDPVMMHQLREGLPALRNLNIQFGKTWVPVQYHMVPIHQGLGKIDAGIEFIDLLLDLISVDLQNVGTEVAAA